MGQKYIHVDSKGAMRDLQVHQTDYGMKTIFIQNK
jgi:hypothetical protein